MKTTPDSRQHGLATWALIAILAGTAGATFLTLMLYQNIVARKAEATQHVFRVVEVDENTTDPALWGKNYPRQYDSYKRTVDTERTNHGGSEAFQRLDEFPLYRTLFAGYAFGVDYREERGHAYMLSDQDETERVIRFKQPGSCLHCHSSVLPAYIAAGIADGIPDDPTHREAQIQRGFEKISPLPFAEARQLVTHPVSCIDCHDAETMNLRVSRPGFINGIRALAESNEATPHLPSIERWRRDGRQGNYEPNLLATRQEMRSMVCAQCHVEYNFEGPNKLVNYPWDKGLKVEQVEAYYNETGHTDWTHAESGAKLLKAQHPEFEMWSQGIHARSGVACADCHMPYKREGAIKVSDHQVRSPMLNVARSCQVCHNYPESEIQARVATIQDRTKAHMDRAEDAVVDLIKAIAAAKAAGATDEQLKGARDLQRRAQWRCDFINAENSMGFHAPAEAVRILGESIDYARQGQVEVLKLGVAPKPAGEKK